MSLTYPWFALAGMIAAAALVAIHLWNRRRYRTVGWGATAFLARALGRTRRRLQLRELLLLALRILALLLFGLTLARPIVRGDPPSIAAIMLLGGLGLSAVAGIVTLITVRSRGGRILAVGLFGGGVAGFWALWQSPLLAETRLRGVLEGEEPIHAIVVIDNSHSMGTLAGETTWLQTARTMASGAISRLPDDSRVSVLPLCGDEDETARQAYRERERAQAAVTRVKQTDQAESASRMLTMIARAAETVPEIPLKQALFVTDLRASGWPEEFAPRQVPRVPLRIVPVDDAPAGRPANLSITSFTIRDGFAETDSPATFLATVTNAGPRAAKDVEVTLTFDGKVVLSDVIDFQPGQERHCQWTVPISAESAADRTLVKSARLTIHGTQAEDNRLPRDDDAYLAVPLVGAVPVLFVDQHGREEDLDAGRMGETHSLRRLLAPRPAEGDYDPFVDVRQATIEELDRSMLSRMRLVVVAGVPAPTSESVAILREYVNQGGALLIAAGAEFDPVRWNDLGWRDGLGILPAPLAPRLGGVRPSRAGKSEEEIVARQIDPASLRDSLFQIPRMNDDELAAFWRQPFFFQVAQAHLDESVRQTALETEMARIRAQRREGDAPAAWLSWQTDDSLVGGAPDVLSNGSIEELARTRLPRVLARLAPAEKKAGRLPLVIERKLGHGRVLFLTSGMSSDWNTLARTNAIILLDRMARSLIRETLPERNLLAGTETTLAIPSLSDAIFVVTSPGDQPRRIDPHQSETGNVVAIRETAIAGFIRAKPEVEERTGLAELFAVNAPESESDLKRLDKERLDRWCRQFTWEVAGPTEAIPLDFEGERGSGPWRWLAGLVFVCLLVEMAMLSRTSPRWREVSS